MTVADHHMLVSGGLALFIFVSLFGDSSIFRGTPVHWLHWLVTKGCCQGFWYIELKLAIRTCLLSGRNYSSVL